MLIVSHPRRHLRAFLVLAALAAALSPAAAQQASTSQLVETQAATTQGQATGPSDLEGLTGDIDVPPTTIGDALSLTEDQRQALLVARSRKGQLDESALYIMLAKAASVNRASRYDPARLAQPIAADLERHSDLYVGQPMRISIVPFRVQKLLPGRGLSYSRDWPADAPVWSIRAMASESDVDVPLLILSVTEPDIRGQWAEVAPNAWDITAAQVLEVQGVYYKLYSGPDTSGKVRDFPVLIAWRVGPVAKPVQITGQGGWSSGPIIGLLGVAILVFLFIRNKARGQRRDGSYSTAYRPLREELAEIDEHLASRSSADPADVDPELKQAVSDALKKKQDKDKHPSTGNEDEPHHRS